MDLKLWWFALQKPVKENDKRIWDSFDVVAKWLISTRATVTQLTLLAGVIAGLLALRDGYFNFPLWLAMTLGIYFAHSSENLVNDYIDFTRGIDEDNYYRGQYGIHPLVHKFWTKQDWARWFVTAAAVAVIRFGLRGRSDEERAGEEPGSATSLRSRAHGSVTEQGARKSL